ncbi:MAG TPA: hypothetical protein VFA33_01625 [Bryobacteraceae bacterium]|nr:hypothetical protein [Bryobacteraceae bacterium]
MNIETMNLLPFAVIWAVLAVIVIFLILYRRSIAHQEDDTLRVLEGSEAISQQVQVAKRLEVIDRWGKMLTVVALVYGVAVGVAYVYQNWVRASNLGM